MLAIKSMSEMLMIRNICKLGDGKKYNMFRIAKASGSPRNFFKSRLHERLQMEGYLIFNPNSRMLVFKCRELWNYYNSFCDRMKANMKPWWGHEEF